MLMEPMNRLSAISDVKPELSAFGDILLDLYKSLGTFISFANVHQKFNSPCKYQGFFQQ